MIITIDGPAGTGKSTIAKEVARRLHFSFFDTGAMYRSVTYLLLQNRVSAEEEERVRALLEKMQFEIVDASGGPRYLLQGVDVTEAIRAQEVTRNVSAASAVGCVRELLVGLQRQFSRGKNAVFEGRDLGTVVFPEAEVKIYLTAKAAVRAKRRFAELRRNGRAALDLTEAQVLEEIERRDQYDSTRALSPLRPASDAVIVDTSDLTIPQVIDAILACIPKEMR